MILFLGLMYGLFVTILLTCFSVAKEADERMEEIIAIERAKKRVENYYPKR